MSRAAAGDEGRRQGEVFMAGTSENNNSRGAKKDGELSGASRPKPSRTSKSERFSPATAGISLDRVPPHSIEAEMGLLGSMLLSSEAIGECLEKVNRRNLDQGFFYDPRHLTVFEAILDLWDARQPVDIITLTQKLRDKGLLEAAGGPAYISNLINCVPTAANLDYYLEITRDKYCLRRLIQVCTEVVTRSFEAQDNVTGLIDETEQAVFDLNDDRDTQAARSLSELTKETMAVVEDLVARRGAITGLPTGFRDLDRITSGLQAGDVIVIAGRPSMGKTSLAMNIAEHVALDHEHKTEDGQVKRGAPVGVFSLEMSAQQLVMRLLCSRAAVNLRKLRDGFLSERERADLTTTASLLHRAPIYVDDTPALDIFQLRTRARRMKAQHDIQLFVIDYLQLLRSENRRAENRQQEISYISGGVKALAKELKVPVILLSQLNRQPDSREGGRPRLSDLRESGAIEQDADVVGLLLRPEQYEEDEDKKEAVKGEAILYIAKQRNGPTGDVELTFLHELTRFTDRAKGVDEDSHEPEDAA
jgi:replicative DNA helicase